MGSEFGLVGYSLRSHEGETNNCFSKIQLVGKKYRHKTTLVSKTRFSRHCLGFHDQSRRFSLPVGYNIQPSSSSTNQNSALIIDHQLDFTNTSWSMKQLSLPRVQLLQFQLASVVCFVKILFRTGYLENYGPDKQHIILLHVYSSLNHVKQSSTDSDSEGKMATLFPDSLLPVPTEREN